MNASTVRTDDATLAQWDAWVRSGQRTLADIGREYGLSKNAIGKRLARWRDGQSTTEPVPPPAPAEGGLIFPDLKQRSNEEEFASRYLDLVIEQQELEESQNNEQDVAHVVIPDNKPVGLVFTGDWHLGNTHTDHGAIKEHLACIRETDGLYMAGMGDYCDWFIGRMIRLAVTEQQFKPAQQRVIARDLLLRKTGGKALWLLAGNHCWKPEELTGEDPVADIAAEAKVPYLGYGGTAFVRLGDEEYKAATWHSYPGGSAINPGNNNRRLRNDYPNLDIDCLGHFHYSYSQEVSNREGQDCVDLRSGSFKVRDARYAAMRVGVKHGDSRMPMAILFPDRHRIWHIRDYREWLPLLSWLRAEYRR